MFLNENKSKSEIKLTPKKIKRGDFDWRGEGIIFLNFMNKNVNRI